jgi:hypothetical protein
LRIHFKPLHSDIGWISPTDIIGLPSQWLEYPQSREFLGL